MKLVFLIDNMNFSGGRKLFFEYADFLRQAGHSVRILAKEKKGELINFSTVEYVKAFNAKTIPDCDLIVTTTHREVADAVAAKKTEVAFFCQTYEITDLEQHLRGEIVPPQLQKKTPLNKLKLFRKRLAWKHKLQYLKRIYNLPTHLITISKHLQHELKQRYKRPVKLCTNGVHQEFFYPAENWRPPVATASRPLKIVNVGAYDISFKGVATTLKAIELLKSKDIPVHFSRVTPKATETDKTHSCIDQLYQNLSQEALGDLLRECDVFISNSTPGEGFGLPAMEAISSGLICILSSIPSYQAFNDTHDFCYFVPANDVWATVNTVETITETDGDTLTKMRNKALKVATFYSHERACKRFEKILSDIVKKSKEDADPEQ